jgi:HSP20 family protein
MDEIDRFFEEFERRWGRLRRLLRGVESCGYEPFAEIYEDDEHVRVLVEIPGAEKDKISVRLVPPNKIVIDASGENRKYHKEIYLDREVVAEGSRSTYKNGLLTIELKKARRETGIEIKVE